MLQRPAHLLLQEISKAFGENLTHLPSRLQPTGLAVLIADFKCPFVELLIKPSRGMRRGQPQASAAVVLERVFEDCLWEIGWLKTIGTPRTGSLNFLYFYTPTTLL